MKDFFTNDKLMAILCVTAICCVSIYLDPHGSKDIIMPIITGIFGMATGGTISK
jgi:hypothetical protein